MGGIASKSPADATGVSTHIPEDGVEQFLDPRSPTPAITRTPLQESSSGNYNITKKADLSKIFEKEDYENMMMQTNTVITALIKNHLQQYDPRSPTQDFDRTPVIPPSKILALKHEIRYKQLQKSVSPLLQNDSSPPLIEKISKKLCDEFIDLSLNDSQLSNESVVSKGINSSKLLETDFEYVPNKPTDKNVYKEEDLSKHKSLQHIKVLKRDPRSPSVGINRTPIVVMQGDVSTDNVDLLDDKLIKALQLKTDTMKQTLLNKRQNSNDVLIYEDDQNETESPPRQKIVQENGSRTPLSCMKNLSRSKSDDEVEKRKVGNHMKTHRKPSNIPRLRALSKRSGSLPVKVLNAVVQSDENTPPSSKNNI